MPRRKRLPQPEGGDPDGDQAVPGCKGLGAAEHDPDPHLQAEGPAQQVGHGHGSGGEVGLGWVGLG